MLSDDDINPGNRASDDDSTVPLAILERIDTGSLLANVMDELPSMSSPPDLALINDGETTLNRTVSDWPEGDLESSVAVAESAACPKSTACLNGDIHGEIAVGGKRFYTAESGAGGFDDTPAERQTLKIEQPDGAVGGNSSLLMLPTLDNADASVRQTDVAIAECGLRTCQLAGDVELPCLLPFAGDLDFSVTVADVDSELQQHQQQMSIGRATGVKLASYVYTPELDKVYVDMMSAVPFRLQCRRAASWPHRLPQLFVRCLPVYPNSDQLLEPVVRCPAHRQSSHPSNRHVASASQLPHLVRALHPHAFYRQSTACLRTRYSVLVPWPITLLNYQFACMNTCVGGVARRRLALLFQLEDAECRVYGRSTLQLKVCKCPHRDARHELARWRKNNPSAAPSKTIAPTAVNPVPTVDLPLVSGFKREVCENDGMGYCGSKRAAKEKRSDFLFVPVANYAEYRVLIDLRDSLRRIVKDYRDEAL